MAEYKDMIKTNWWHVPELACDRSLPEMFTATMVGWIEKDIWRKGVIDKNRMEKLTWLSINSEIDQGLLGYHRCELGEP